LLAAAVAPAATPATLAPPAAIVRLRAALLLMIVRVRLRRAVVERPAAPAAPAAPARSSATATTYSTSTSGHHLRLTLRLLRKRLALNGNTSWLGWARAATTTTWSHFGSFRFVPLGAPGFVGLWPARQKDGVAAGVLRLVRPGTIPVRAPHQAARLRRFLDRLPRRLMRRAERAESFTISVAATDAAPSREDRPSRRSSAGATHPPQA